MKPIEYAQVACDTLMRKYAAQDLPPKGTFLYHQGVFLSGMYQTYQQCEKEVYYNYIKEWIDSVFDRNGQIKQCEYSDLDYIQPGVLLFPIWDRTGNPYYRKCIEAVCDEVKHIPRNLWGGWWHKNRMKDQMWLDGLYMVGPFCAEYADRFEIPELKAEIVRQALLMERMTKDPDTGLLYHAWDGARQEDWADPVTGQSREFWGRSMGWVPVALLNDLDFIGSETQGHEEIIRMSTELLRNLCHYQSEDGRWYQVVNKGGEPGNWLENSCSCLYVAGLCKAVRRNYLPTSFIKAAVKGYEGVVHDLQWDGDNLLVGNVCIGTGVGDYQFYCDRPVNTNDLHGVGAFLLMCTEMQWLLDAMSESNAGGKRETLCFHW